MSLIEKALLKSSQEKGHGGQDRDQGEPDGRALISVPKGRSKRILVPSLVLLLAFLGAFSWVIFFSPISPLRVPSPPISFTPIRKDEAPPSIPGKEHIQTPKKASSVPDAHKKDEDLLKKEERTLREGERTPPVEAKAIHHDEKKKQSHTKSIHDIPQLPSTPVQPSPSPERRLELLLEKAYLYGRAGRFSEAIDLYSEFLQQRPDHFEALLNRGILRQKIGDMDGAEMDLLKAKEKEPGDHTLLNALGVLYMQTGRGDEAIPLFKQARMATSLINLSLIYWRDGDWDKVISTLHEAEQIEPQNPYIFYYRGLFLIQSGKNVLARQELEKAQAIARKKGMRELLDRIESIMTGS